MSGEKRRTIPPKQETEDKRIQQRIKELEREQATERKEIEKKLKKEQNERIKKMEKTIERETKEHLKRIREDQEVKLQAQETRLDNKISKIETTINSIQNDLHTRYEREEEIAKAWIRKLNQLLQTIEDNYDHQKHSPGAKNNLQSKLSHIQTLYNESQYQAATANSSQTYYEAENLLLELEQKTLEFQETLYQTTHMLHHLKEFLKESETTPFTLPTISGEEHTSHISVDYWSFKGLTPIKELLDNIEERLTQKESLTTSQLKGILKDMEDVPKQIQVQTNEARSRYYSQIYASDIQEAIAQSLTEQGFSIIGNEQEDEREANVLLLERRGEKVMTIVDYDSTKKAPDFTIRFNSPQEETRQERLSLILKAINEELGTHFSPEEMKATPGYEQRPVEEDRLRLKEIHEHE